jgi:site-specific DNA-methyltransferase (adenine-specific)
MSWKDLFPKENRYFETENGILYNRDVLECLKQIPNESIDCVITSPPYWALRDYGIEGQLGLEPTFHEYLEKLWCIFDEVYRVLKPTGTLWVNLGDTYFSKTKGRIDSDYTEKCLCMIPERFAIGMIERGWILRNQIIWHKPNCMPQSVKDRFTVDFEKIFFFVKQRKYYFEQILEPYSNNSRIEDYKGRAIKEYEKHLAQNPSDTKRRIIESMKRRGGRNKRTVWSITTRSFKGAHFAVFPPEIPEICIKAGCPKDGIVMDIFMGTGTTADVAEQLNRRWIGIELEEKYCEIAKKRIEEATRQRKLFEMTE